MNHTTLSTENLLALLLLLLPCLPKVLGTDAKVADYPELSEKVRMNAFDVLSTAVYYRFLETQTKEEEIEAIFTFFRTSPPVRQHLALVRDLLQLSRETENAHLDCLNDARERLGCDGLPTQMQALMLESLDDPEVVKSLSYIAAVHRSILLVRKGLLGLPVEDLSLPATPDNT